MQAKCSPCLWKPDGFQRQAASNPQIAEDMLFCLSCPIKYKEKKQMLTWEKNQQEQAGGASTRSEEMRIED
jgi:hypothetical protein